MKTCIHPHFSFWQKLFLFLLFGAFLGASGPLSAAPGARKLLAMELSTDRRSADVQVPAGFGVVTLQRFNRDGGWQRFSAKKATVGVMKFKLPVTGKGVRWRAIGRFEVKEVSHGKFPASFYKGKNNFGPLKSADGGGSAWPGGKFLMNSAGPDVAGDGTTTGSIDPVEADIWKTDGNTVYFFNQLRGLQVLDVSNPADPRLTASLRLPAVGQDLYLLPGSASNRTVVLLTEGWSDNSGQWTRINVVKLSGGKAEITFTQDVSGSLSDSRLVGNRLILATSEWADYSVNASGEWSSRTRLSEWLLSAEAAPKADGETMIEGDSPLIAAGAEWLALAVHPNGRWDVSAVSVFAVRPEGLVRMAPPIRTEGSISSKFGMQWSGNVLTTISEDNWDEWNWSPTTVLENFRVWSPDVVRPAVVGDEDPHLGRLELAKGESLFATRFAGNKAYVVTYLQKDPLWVVDLSDPAAPVIAGHLDVPGWSSHLEPIGNLLLSVGWESNTVAASLFDVADPAAPKLLRRLNLGAPGSYSEASWDEQALKVLPDAGLAMIPLTSYDDATGKSTSVVQLLDLDLTGGDLKKRGTIAHEFDARRSDLIGNTVVSISQRVLVAADITNRDAPVVLSEVSLAWPVDRVLEAGNKLLQIEAGTSYGYGRATVRVSPATAPEQILAETDLGEGMVRAADFRDGKLYVLRQIGSTQPFYYRRAVISDAGGVTGGDASGRLILDVYNASYLPALPLLGSCSMKLGDNMQVAGNGLLWPQSNRPAVVLDAGSSYWYWWGGPIMIDTPVAFAASAKVASVKPSYVVDHFPFWRQRVAPKLVVFDVTQADAPTVAIAVKVGTEETIPNGVYEAADGLVVMGGSDWKNEENGVAHPVGKAVQAAHIIEVAPTGDPVVRPGIDLPGELFAVTELDHDGFLAFTRNYDSGDGPAFRVSACDGFDAFEVAGLDESPDSVVVGGGRRLFVAKPGGVERHLLGDDGSWTTESKLDVGWKPEILRWSGNTLMGTNWSALFAADAADDTVMKWSFPAWSLQLDNISVAPNGDLLVPFGEYGAERLDR